MGGFFGRAAVARRPVQHAHPSLPGDRPAAALAPTGDGTMPALGIHDDPWPLRAADGRAGQPPIPPHARLNSRIDGRYRCRYPRVTPQARNALTASCVGPGLSSQGIFGGAAIELATASLLLPGGEEEATYVAAADTATRTSGRTRPVSPSLARALGAPHDDTQAESRTGWASRPCEATRSHVRPGR